MRKSTDPTTAPWATQNWAIAYPGTSPPTSGVGSAIPEPPSPRQYAASSAHGRGTTRATTVTQRTTTHGSSGSPAGGSNQPRRTVKAYQASPAGQLLTKKIKDSNDAYSEAFLNAAQGEKVAFVEKTTSYIHRGSAKFDVPFDSARYGSSTWIWDDGGISIT